MSCPLSQLNIKNDGPNVENTVLTVISCPKTEYAVHPQAKTNGIQKSRMT